MEHGWREDAKEEQAAKRAESGKDLGTVIFLEQIQEPGVPFLLVDNFHHLHYTYRNPRHQVQKL